MTCRQPPSGAISYTYDHFIVRDERTGKTLYQVPYAAYEQMHALVTDPEGAAIIRRVREMKP